jgi:hypothetical protein
MSKPTVSPGALRAAAVLLVVQLGLFAFGYWLLR